MLMAPTTPRDVPRVVRAAAALSALGLAAATQPLAADDAPTLLRESCGSCHCDGAEEGGVALDGLLDRLGGPDELAESDVTAWAKVVKNVRAGIMPPAEEPQPTSQ